MAYDNTTEPGIRAARAAMAAAIVTFCTTTLPPLAQTLYALVTAADPNLEMCIPPEDAHYMATVIYVNNYLIPAGLYAGTPLPLR